MTNGEKLVWAAAFAVAAQDPAWREVMRSGELAAHAGQAADEAVRLLRLRAEYDADAKEMLGA
jgi:hypothetical protein